MLIKKNRLRKKKDFEKVLREGKGFKEGCLILKIKKNKLEEPRFGFIVSQKVSKKAVVRNKIKRRLREAIRDILTDINKRADIILIALPRADSKGFQGIKDNVIRLLKKAKTIDQ